MPADERVQLLHPDPAKSAPRIARAKYDLVRRAMLQVIPAAEPGIAFSALPAAIERLLTPDEARSVGSMAWYTISVKLDLEARRLIVRIPGSGPQRLRRA